MRIARFMLFVVAGIAGSLHADRASHEAATKKLFDAMHMEETTAKTLKQINDQQVEANPTIAPYREIMLEFMNKYISWASLESEMTKIYMEAFTEDELNELAAFYATPTGQKAIKSMPELLVKGAAIGEQRVQEHMPELQQKIAEAAAKKK